MDNDSLIFKEDGFSIYRKFTDYGVRYSVYKSERLGEFSNYDKARRLCKTERSGFDFKLWGLFASAIILGVIVLWVFPAG